MTYSIHYDLMNDPGRKPAPEDDSCRAARKNLATAVEAYPWATFLGPFFARVCVAEFRGEVPSAFRFEFGGEPPTPGAMSKLVSRIDHIVGDLRKPRL